MATLEDGARAFAAAHPLTSSGTSWANGCARLMWNWGASLTPGWSTAGEDVSTAAKAMNLSALYFPVSVNDILPGRFVWLSLPGSVDGHVGFCVAGQGVDALIFWATDVLQIRLGNFIGFGTVREYEASYHHGVFQGVSDDYAGELPNLSQFASTGGATPIPAPIVTPDTQGDTMRIAYETLNADGNHYVAHLIHDDGYIVDSIDNQAGWNGVLPFVPNPIYVIYVDLFDPRQGNINPVLTEEQWQAFVARIASNWVKPGAAASIDPVQLVAALAPALAALLPEVSVAQLTAAIAPVLTAIQAAPAAVVKAEGAALANG